MPTKNKRFRMSAKWQRTIIIILPLAALLFAYIYQINTLPKIDAGAEGPAVLAVDSGRSILAHVSYAPQRFIDYVIFKLGLSDVLYFRLISVGVAIAAVVSFFWVIKEWISTRIAFMAGVLLASSTWMLQEARWAGPETMLLLAIPALFLAGTFLKIKEYDSFIPLTTFLVLMTLYIPGFWIFVAVGILFVYKDLIDVWKELGGGTRLLWLALAATAIAPLAYMLTRPGNLRIWLGLPESDFSLGSFAENLRNLPAQLFTTGIDNMHVWLPGTPVIDVVTTVFFIVGAYYVARDQRFPLRRVALFCSLLICILLVGVMGSTYISLLLPLIYIFAAFGAAFILEQWLHIFPLNPMARSFGVALVAVLIIFISSYHVLRYHYVWPRSYDVVQSQKS